MTESLIECVSLIDQAGIRKPVSTKGALSIRTTFTPPSAVPPSQDEEDADGLLRYQIRATDPQQSDNVALHRAMDGRQHHRAADLRRRH